MVSDAITCPLHKLNALWYTSIVLYAYDKQVLTICSIQERQLSPIYFLVFLHLMVKATMHSVNIVRNIFRRLYGSVEEVMTTCHYKKCGGS